LPAARKITTQEIPVAAKIADARGVKEGRPLKSLKMITRDLLLLINNRINQQQLDKTVEGLNKMLLQAESNHNFCQVHELARRSRITNNAKKILKAICSDQLKPFYFLINKN
jgi:hypothetical protein